MRPQSHERHPVNVLIIGGGIGGLTLALMLVIGAAVDDLSECGTMKIHCQTTDPGMAEALRRNGFHQSRGDYRFRARCNYLADPDPCRRFFLMTGDSDNDFTELPPTLSA